jgi:hypothetical protein
VAQPVEVHVEDRHVAAQADCHLERVEADRAGAEDHHVARRHAGDAREQDAPPAVRLAQVVGALLHRQPARHLAHRREERQAPVRALHRLVRDRDGARLLERPREVGHGRQVEVREQDLLRPEPGVLRPDGLLDL